jgi:hypothetical protein
LQKTLLEPIQDPVVVITNGELQKQSAGEELKFALVVIIVESL